MSAHEPEILESLSIISEIPAIESILDVICKNTGMGFSAVAIVTDKKWIAAAVQDEINFGLKPGGELQLESTICNEIRQHGQEVVIDHVAEDEQFAFHHTPAQYGFQSYISIPIFLKDGHFFGTLCAIDPKPASLKTPQTIGMFKLYADLISFYIQSIQQVRSTEARLADEIRNAEIRELFVAILGHDLRNPLSAASNAGKLIQRLSHEQPVVDLARIVQNSSYRMKALIDNVVDYSRTRVGTGWNTEIKAEPELHSKLAETIAELQMNWQNSEINFEYSVTDAVNCDAGQISQLLSNLITNALIHGAEDTPVTIKADSFNGSFNLTVTNQGEPINEQAMANIFKPFSQSGDQSGKNGLGLGLYIVSEIAKAHNGSVTVISDKSATSFTVTLPA